MPQFFNPYHFAPVARRQPRPGDLPIADFRDNRFGALSHARYQPGTHSGRILCRLTTVTPGVVGAKQRQRPGQATLVENYAIDNVPAFPASTLRGAISALAEAASNSAPRVLNDGYLSFRRPMSQALSAIGMFWKDASGPTLLPIAAPFLTPEGRGGYRMDPLYAPFFPGSPGIRIYFGIRNEIRDPGFALRTFRLSSGANTVYGMRCDPPTSVDDIVQVARPHMDRKGTRLLAQRAETFAYPVPWASIPPHDRTNYLPGILRVLGCEGRDIPDNKTHELFLPLPPFFAPDANGNLTFPGIPLTRIPLPSDVIEAFEQLADQRTEQEPKLPFEPRDTRRNITGGNSLRLKNGDLVYFKLAPRDNKTVVSEISMSAIWRGRVQHTSANGVTEAATVHDFFRHIDPDLVPLRRRPGRTPRTRLTLAERLFGFVEDVKLDKSQPRLPPAALAGRVRFSAAILEPGGANRANLLLPETTLKILGSPKPPSPAFYFGTLAPKSDLAPGSHSPLGRKFYLHHGAERVTPAYIGTAISRDQPPYKAHLDQKLSVTPVASNKTFLFHIDFDNLSKEELGLLLYSLAPTLSFRHKIGLGKPLGLGSVHIEPVAFMAVNRAARYSAEGYAGPRYSQIWRGAAAPASYEGQPLPVATPNFDIADLRAAFQPLPAIAHALSQLGNPASTAAHEVRQPLASGQLNLPARREHETFKWYVNNDHRDQDNHQRLKPIGNGTIEPLETNNPPPPRQR